MKLRKSFAWFLVILWMGLIFYLSAQTGSESSSFSSQISQQILTITANLLHIEPWSLEQFNQFLRIFAHFFSYFVLGILVMNALKFDQRTSWVRRAMLAQLISSVYALSDEIHQYFVPNRASELFDLLVDSAGASFGILLFVVIHYWFQRRKHSKALL